MSDEILNNLASNQCCPECSGSDVVVGVDIGQDESQQVLLQCQDCFWEHRTTLKNIQDAGFCPSISVENPQTIHRTIIQFDSQTVLLEFTD
ncbi:hypothetical protein [Nostoc sp.]|uniref:hypothetical protein n=1 Tax=Nostoc sp. TaxID=1180 RepID=UPI002FF7E73E